MYVPEHLKDFDKTDLERAQIRLQTIEDDSKKSWLHTPEMFNKYLGVKNCTSCRKWWPALFIGGSVGVNFAYSILHPFLAVATWVLFWAYIYFFINHKNNTIEKYQEFKGMGFMQTVDAILGASSQNFLYFICLILCAVVAVPWYLILKILTFVAVWGLAHIMVRTRLLFKYSDTYDEVVVLNREEL